MASSAEQFAATTARPQSAATREALIRAAIDVIAERGSPGMTTRAVAERAQLPHGSVSYHFHGKRELVREAVYTALADMFAPLTAEADEPAADTSLPEWLASWADQMADPRHTRLFLASVQEAQHDPVLRERFTTMLRTFRSRIAAALQHEQQASAETPGLSAVAHEGTGRPGAASATAMATVVAAALDGLVLHAALDPDLDVMAALASLNIMLTRGHRHA